MGLSYFIMLAILRLFCLLAMLREPVGTIVREATWSLYV
jgi:hypothetical protein